MEAVQRYLTTSGKRVRAFVESELLSTTKIRLDPGEVTSHKWREDYDLADVDLPEPWERDVHYFPEIVSKEVRHHLKFSIKSAV